MSNPAETERGGGGGGHITRAGVYGTLCLIGSRIAWL